MAADAIPAADAKQKQAEMMREDALALMNLGLARPARPGMPWRKRAIEARTRHQLLKKALKIRRAEARRFEGRNAWMPT